MADSVCRLKQNKTEIILSSVSESNSHLLCSSGKTTCFAIITMICQKPIVYTLLKTRSEALDFPELSFVSLMELNSWFKTRSFFDTLKLNLIWIKYGLWLTPSLTWFYLSRIWSTLKTDGIMCCSTFLNLKIALSENKQAHS